jgi:hypothetical protein
VINYTRTGLRTFPHRFLQASLKIFDFDFLLKRDVADGVSLLTELAPEVFTAENKVLRHSPHPAKKLLRLVLKHLNLTLQPPTIVLSRAFKVVVHLLNVCHEVRKMGSLHRQCPVLLYQTVLNALEYFQYVRRAKPGNQLTSQIFFSARRLAESLRN